MNITERDLISSLTDSVNKLGERVMKLEETINKGRGAFQMFLILLSVIGTVLGCVKLFGK